MREEPSHTTSLRPLNPRSRNGRSAPPCGRKSEKNMDSTLINDIKALVISSLNLEDTTVEDIDENADRKSVV